MPTSVVYKYLDRLAIPVVAVQVQQQVGSVRIAGLTGPVQQCQVGSCVVHPPGTGNIVHLHCRSNWVVGTSVQLCWSPLIAVHFVHTCMSYQA